MKVTKRIHTLARSKSGIESCLGGHFEGTGGDCSACLFNTEASDPEAKTTNISITDLNIFVIQFSIFFSQSQNKPELDLILDFRWFENWFSCNKRIAQQRRLNARYFFSNIETKTQSYFGFAFYFYLFAWKKKKIFIQWNLGALGKPITNSFASIYHCVLMRR